VTINLIIADSQPVVRAGIEQISQYDPDINIMSSVSDGESAMQAVEQHRPDVLLIDIDLPKRDGLSVVDEIQRRQLATKPVIFTSSTPTQVMKALDMGVQGLVGKHNSPQKIAECIRSVFDDKKWLDQDLTSHAVSHLLDQHKRGQAVTQVLTRRELAVSKLILEGLPNKRIASRLGISEGTVKLHLHHIYQKLALPGRMSLVLYLQQHGLA
jgi:two-component system nitrate/nitrite response regulator NarP